MQNIQSKRQEYQQPSRGFLMTYQNPSRPAKSQLRWNKLALFVYNK